MHHLFSKRRGFHYPKATSIQQKSRSAPLAVFPLRRKLFCWGLAFLIGEIFSRSQSLSLAPGILPLILPEFFPPNEGDCSRAVYIILCRQDCPPAHIVMVVPARRRESSRAVYIILYRQDCPPAHIAMVMPARRGGLFRDPPYFLVPEGLPSCTYCHGHACPARGIVP